MPRKQKIDLDKVRACLDTVVSFSLFHWSKHLRKVRLAHRVAERNTDALERLFPQQSLIVDCSSNPLTQISLFAMLNRSAIQDELASVHGDGSTPNWILDLTTTSLFSVLRHWGEVYDELEVFCDKSKPLETGTEILKAMIGRRDHVYMRMFGKEMQFTFNLVREPILVDSTQHAGVQIADVFASSLASAMQNRYWGKGPSDEQEWLDITEECLLDDSVWPQLELTDLETRHGFVNAMILAELTDRCLKKENLFRGMPEFIAYAKAVFPDFLRSQCN